MTLPGIGPTLAQRIVRYREENGPFADVSEIKEIPGIREKRYERIKQWIRVGGGGRMSFQVKITRVSGPPRPAAPSHPEE